MSVRRFFFLFAAAGVIAGCDSPDDQDNVLTEPEPRYYEDVAPILAESCNGCHKEGGVAPFSLESYEDARAWAPAIAAAVEARTMPPWNVNNDGSCQTYHDARWLFDDEIETLREWADLEAPEGDATLGVPEPPAPRTLEGPAVVSHYTPRYTPVAAGIEAAEFDDYQCFLIDPELVSDRFLVGFDVVPGDDRVVHHVVGFNVDPQLQMGPRTNAQVMEELDAQYEGPGWDCYAAAGEGVVMEGVPLTWAPGSGATNFPDGTGIRIKAGQKFVIQMHYSLIDAGPTEEQTEIKFAFADEVEREGHMALIDGLLLSLLGRPAELEPGREDVQFSWSRPLNQVPNLNVDLTDVELLGILPHMHQRGRKMTIQVERNDGMQCAGNVDRWDFNWQQSFFYEQAIPMTGTDQLHVTCEYDTRGDTEPVGPGFGTDAEMCLVGLFVAQR